MNISIKEITGPYCGEYSDGEKVYEIICGHLKKNEYLTLDFSGIDVLSSSFFNGSIAKLFLDFPSDFLVGHISIIGMKKIDRYVLNRVVRDAEQIKETVFA
ncbi:MAG: STAS-like domain-containing protein [Nitrospiraceae bacterium]|nr:STAS-like domain-containing protein [Nitrospiraceae bacterium]